MKQLHFKTGGKTAKLQNWRVGRTIPASPLRKQGKPTNHFTILFDGELRDVSPPVIARFAYCFDGERHDVSPPVIAVRLLFRWRTARRQSAGDARFACGLHMSILTDKRSIAKRELSNIQHNIPDLRLGNGETNGVTHAIS